MVDEVTREVVLGADRREVWASLTVGEQLSAWFGADATLELRPGGRADFRFRDGRTRSAVIERIDEPRFLAFRWAPFVREPDGAAHQVPATRVEIELEPAARGTRLVVRETPLASPGGEAQPEALRDLLAGVTS